MYGRGQPWIQKAQRGSWCENSQGSGDEKGLTWGRPDGLDVGAKEGGGEDAALLGLSATSSQAASGLQPSVLAPTAASFSLYPHIFLNSVTQ